VAGTVKNAGLPNITGVIHPVNGSQASGAFHVTSTYAEIGLGSGSTYTVTRNGDTSFDASRSSSIYGNSDTVQPPALTMRYIIKAFDGQTADSALIDITQYAQELAGKANITGSNLVHHRDVITTSGTYTVPATGLYKITVKGGGGGGCGGGSSSSWIFGGAGGGEGGTTIAYGHMTVGDSATIVIGGGGAGGAAASNGANGGDSTVTIGLQTITGGGGGGGLYTTLTGGTGGTGTIIGCPGEGGDISPSGGQAAGRSGGGAGGAAGSRTGTPVAGVSGGGGAGGSSSTSPGTAGGDGYVWFEYYTPGA
jgi:hypothetical protein